MPRAIKFENENIYWTALETHIHTKEREVLKRDKNTDKHK